MSRKIIAATAAFATITATLIAAPAAEAAGRGANHVRATAKHTVVSASTMRPGLARLRNDGARPLALFRKKHEGVDQLVRYMNADGNREAKKAFTRFGFVEIVLSHADDYLTLRKGTYYLVDVSGMKIKSTGVRSVAVRGARADVVRPASARNLRVSPSGVITGATTGSVRPYLRLVNRSAAPRLLQTLKIKTTATPAQVNDAIAHPSTRKLFALVDGYDVSFVGFVGSRQDVTVRTPLRAGRYFVVASSAFGSGGFGHPRLLTLS